MRMTWLRTPLVAVIVGPALLAIGCNAMTPFGTFKTYGSTQPTYVAGYAGQNFPAPTSREVVAQVREAMDDLGIRTIAQRQEEPSTVLEGRTADDRRAMVRVRPEGAATHVSVRFGALGDEALSRAFLARVGTRIGTEPAADQGHKRERDSRPTAG